MVNEQLDRVRRAIAQPGVTKVGLAQAAGLHRNSLGGVERADWNPTSETLIRLQPHIEAIERGEWKEPTPEQAAA